MRIGLSIEHFDPRRGGAEQWTYQFAKRLLAEGHEVHVVARDFAGPGETLAVSRHELPGAHSRLGFAAATEEKLRSLDLDVIHDMGGGWYCDLFESHDGSRLAQWERKMRALPAWARPLKRFLIRVLPRYRDFRKLFNRQLADPNHLVLALSEMVARDYREYHDVSPERIRLIYNGVDTNRFTPDSREIYRGEVRDRLAVEEDEVLFLFVGHDFQRKGLATVVRATGRLLDEGLPARLAVVGGRRHLRYDRLVQRSGARDAVVFVGSVEDTVPYYAAADVYVLPTFYDPCSLGVLEAASAGLPCITTESNGAGELLTHGTNGYLLSDPADYRRLADYMRELFDERLRIGMGRAARDLAMKHTLEANCRQIVDVYREIAAGRVRARAA